MTPAHRRATGIYLQVTGSSTAAFGRNIEEIWVYAGDIASHWSEIATYSREIAADIAEMAENRKETGSYRR